MAIRYKIEGTLVDVTFEGTTETKEILETFERALTDPNLQNGSLLLVDVSGSTSLQERSSASIRMLAESVARWSDKVSGKLAVVVGKPVQYGIIRMASVYAASFGLDLRPFETREEALSWLGLPPYDPV